MTMAAGLAFAAGAMGVVAVWEALAAVEQATVVRTVQRVVAPLRAARAAGRTPSVRERRRLAIVAAVTIGAGGWLVAGPLAGLAAGLGGPWAVAALVRAHRRRWSAELAAGAPAAARAIADALGGGHGVRNAIGLAAAGGSVPGAAGRELARCAAQLELGAPTAQVLDGLRRRAGDPCWETIVAAILLQRRVGGDLAGLLRQVAASQEEARRLTADARTVTAQARFTAQLVAGLPAGAAVVAELASPGYLAALASRPLTAALGVSSAALALVALIAIRRIAEVGSSR